MGIAIIQQDKKTMTLDTSPASDYACDAFPDGRTYFDEVVDTTGLAQTQLLLGTNASGQFTGNFQNPSQVTYNNLFDLAPPEGGLFEASLSFSATAVVPEPASMSVIAVGLFTLGARRRRG